MNIAVEKILSKMDEHLQAAKHQPEAKLREQITAIRTLCDLVLDDNREETNVKSITQQIQVIHPIVNRSQPIDSDANGDSLFDF